jgi:MFS family permease
VGRDPKGDRYLTGPRLFLLTASFLITVGSFAVLPYMSVLLHQELGLGMGVVGMVLAVASLVQFSGGVAGAALARRIGLRAAMLVALAVRTGGFAAFVPGLAHPSFAVAALFLVSCGAALYLPANKAYLVARSSEATRPKLLAASGSAFNAGIALGPPAAAPLVLTSPVLVFTAVTVLFAALAAGHALLPAVADTPATAGTGDPSRTQWPAPDGLAVFPVTLLAVYVFMFFQHYLGLYAVPRTSEVFYSLVLTGYACLLMVGQPLLSHWITRLSYSAAIRIGFWAMAAGLALLATGTHAGIALGAVSLCLGEAVLFMKNDLEALRRSALPAATVFGRQRLAAGLGAFAAGAVGGPLYGAAHSAGRAEAFWLATGVQALVLPVVLLMVPSRRRRPVAGPGSRGQAEPGPACRPHDSRRAVLSLLRAAGRNASWPRRGAWSARRRPCRRPSTRG